MSIMINVVLILGFWRIFIVIIIFLLVITIGVTMIVTLVVVISGFVVFVISWSRSSATAWKPCSIPVHLIWTKSQIWSRIAYWAVPQHSPITEDSNRCQRSTSKQSISMHELRRHVWMCLFLSSQETQRASCQNKVSTRPDYRSFKESGKTP